MEMDTPANTETFASISAERARSSADAPLLPALVVLWGRHGPERAGECLLIPAEGGEDPWVMGCRTALGERRISPLIQAPGFNSYTTPLMEPRVSRDQLLLGRDGPRTWVKNIGRRSLTIDGEAAPDHTAVPLIPGQILNIGDQLLLLFTERPALLPGLPPAKGDVFGEADALGLVGESPALWALRQRIASWAAVDSAHVLIRGPSGSGKEKVAQALHALSPRGRQTLISRSAVSIPEGLMDAELFGNVAGYPNPGMRARPGLLGEAQGSTLFLDEIGELGQELQARLLRVMDEGEYTPLGEARPRRADVRFVAATNRPEGALKHDLLARFTLRLEVPGLMARREDIPLITRHLLGELAARHPTLLAPFRGAGAPSGALPQVSCALMEALVAHPYATHVRELRHLLYQSLEESPGPALLPPSALTSPPAPPSPPSPPHRALAPTPAAPPAPPDPRRIFTDEERRRLALMGQLGFSPTRCGRADAYPTNRQNATLTLTLCFAKALFALGWRVDDALALLESEGGLGPEDGRARQRLRRTLRAFLDNQREAAEARSEAGEVEEDVGEDALGDLRRYGAGARLILHLQGAIRRGALTAEDALLLT